jgi:hypothetical protein
VALTRRGSRSPIVWQLKEACALKQRLARLPPSTGVHIAADLPLPPTGAMVVPIATAELRRVIGKEQIALALCAKALVEPGVLKPAALAAAVELTLNPAYQAKVLTAVTWGACLVILAWTASGTGEGVSLSSEVAAICITAAVVLGLNQSSPRSRCTCDRSSPFQTTWDHTSGLRTWKVLRNSNPDTINRTSVGPTPAISRRGRTGCRRGSDAGAPGRLHPHCWAGVLPTLRAPTITHCGHSLVT